MIEAKQRFPKSLTGIIAGKNKIAPCLSPIATHRSLAAHRFLVVARVEMPEVARLHDFAEQRQTFLAAWSTVEFILLHAKNFAHHIHHGSSQRFELQGLDHCQEVIISRYSRVSRFSRSSSISRYSARPGRNNSPSFASTRYLPQRYAYRCGAADRVH